MSSYSPPSSNSPIYNPSYYIVNSTSLTTSTADLRYLKLTGSVAGGLQTLNGGVNTTNLTVSGSSVLSGVGTPTSLSNVKLNSYDTVNSYFQNNIQNLSSGALASSNLRATCNNGNQTAGFVNMGINSSGFTTAIGSASDSYLYCVADLSSNGGNLWLGTQSPKTVYLFANTATPTASNSMSFDGSIFKTIGLKVGLNGTTHNQELFGTFTLTTPNIVALGSTTQIVNFSNAFASNPNVLAGVSYTSTAGASMNFLIVTVFSVSTTQCSITITNAHPTITTTGDIAISWKAFA